MLPVQQFNTDHPHVQIMIAQGKMKLVFLFYLITGVANDYWRPKHKAKPNSIPNYLFRSVRRTSSPPPHPMNCLCSYWPHSTSIGFPCLCTPCHGVRWSIMSPSLTSLCCSTNEATCQITPSCDVLLSSLFTAWKQAISLKKSVS